MTQKSEKATRQLPWEGEARTVKLFISLEPTLKRVVEERAAELGIAAVADFIRMLIQRDLLEGGNPRAK